MKKILNSNSSKKKHKRSWMKLKPRHPKKVNFHNFTYYLFVFILSQKKQYVKVILIFNSTKKSNCYLFFITLGPMGGAGIKKSGKK